MSLGVREFQFFCELIRRHSGIVLETGKEYLVEARLRPLLASEGIACYGDLVRRVSGSGQAALQEKIISAMTTNETSFFRDQQPFEILREKVMPEIIARCAPQRAINIWCAASSTGQEPYTIAMVLAEHFPELLNWKVTFIASDLSQEVLTRAREGKFGQIEVNRGLPARLLVKYFKKDGLDWRIDERLRKMIEFRQLNLTTPWPLMPRFDLLFIRNVMIYFDVPMKQAILNRVRGVLHPEGYLFLGGAETTLGIDDAYTRAPFDRSGCYRLAGCKGAGHG